MVQSKFITWIQKYFPGITIRIVESLNDTTKGLTYYHRRFLKKEYSVDGNWKALSVSRSIVAADIVAMDSTLPLKRRDSIGTSNGKIPKMGMEMALTEQQLTDLDTLVATSAPDSVIISKLFDDTTKVISGIWERNEAMFLQGLSTGVTLVQDDENVGTGIRADFGYLDANKFGVAALWASNPTTAKPFDDFKKITDKARLDGNVITTFLLDGSTFDAIANTTQAKQLYAFSLNFVGDNIPVPSLEQINALAKSRYKFVFEIVDRAVRYEKNGIQTTVIPWESGAIVGICSEQLGSLVWTKLAEMNHPVEGVKYSTVDDFVLVSKYREHKPLAEFTNSAARVMPVIGSPETIYWMDSNTVQA